MCDHRSMRGRNESLMGCLSLCGVYSKPQRQKNKVSVNMNHSLRTGTKLDFDGVLIFIPQLFWKIYFERSHS